MIDVRMPQLGMGIQEVQIVRWLKTAGARVELDEPLLEVETAKTTTEVAAPASGILVACLYDDGDTVEVSELIAQIDDA
jgi:pyruvate/2-oxoglutarate dehydrogenase complex dihydrolipoamide acyltransferase (E2) component